MYRLGILVIQINSVFLIEKDVKRKWGQEMLERKDMA